MDKHTPGPWEVVEVVRFPGGAQSAQLIGPASRAALYVQHDGSDEGRANVRLAASAPALLAALRDLIVAVDDAVSERTLSAVADRTRAALALATEGGA